MKLSDLKGKYWHKLTDKEMQALKELKPSNKWFFKNIKQPDWCAYPEALAGLMGCWSLNFRDRKRTRKMCRECDCYKKA
jgi:hypothetical protein